MDGLALVLHMQIGAQRQACFVSRRLFGERYVARWSCVSPWFLLTLMQLPTPEGFIVFLIMLSHSHLAACG